MLRVFVWVIYGGEPKSRAEKLAMSSFAKPKSPRGSAVCMAVPWPLGSDSAASSKKHFSLFHPVGPLSPFHKCKGPFQPSAKPTI